ncbi:hypothetical protein L3Y34_013725 [Caenorhabditis briggsae]|uniref:Uncharacterized protein n=1 Tax=Caenorhabditis briggsae TaxID=6238 RepID=A0AAE9CWZ4_CAEBR|nr:hypothetical protein L3Y34_013725 [Caenorhabditis briggsae]
MPTLKVPISRFLQLSRLFIKNAWNIAPALLESYSLVYLLQPLVLINFINDVWTATQQKQHLGINQGRNLGISDMNPTMQAPPSYSTSSMNYFSDQPQFAAPNTKPMTIMTHRLDASVTSEKRVLAQQQKTINHRNSQREVCEQERSPGTSQSRTNEP